jgi:hypothetical protein
MPYTSHGHWFGEGEPTEPAPPQVSCGYPYYCLRCLREVYELEMALAAAAEPAAKQTGPDTEATDASTPATTEATDP